LDDNSGGSTTEAKETKIPPAAPEAGPVLSVIEENAALKQEILSLKNRLHNDGK
jgi:hypothetical protein